MQLGEWPYPYDSRSSSNIASLCAAVLIALSCCMHNIIQPFRILFHDCKILLLKVDPQLNGMIEYRKHHTCVVLTECNFQISGGGGSQCHFDVDNNETTSATTALWTHNLNVLNWISKWDRCLSTSCTLWTKNSPHCKISSFAIRCSANNEKVTTQINAS